MYGIISLDTQYLQYVQESTYTQIVNIRTVNIDCGRVVVVRTAKMMEIMKVARRKDVIY